MVKDYRSYKMSDVRACFAVASDAVISRWIEKGLVSHGETSRGSLKLFTFYISEIVHIGVLTHLSAFGVTQKPDAVKIRMEYELETKYSLKQPNELIKVYEKMAYNLCYLFHTKERLHPIHTSEGTRYKRGERELIGRLDSPRNIAGSFNLAMLDPDERRKADVGGILAVHVGAIANKVGKTLESSILWDKPGLFD